MQVGAAGVILSATISAFANFAGLFYLVFAITGASLSAAIIARLSIVLEFSEPEERPTYIGLTNTVRAPFSAIAPIVGGILGDRFHLPFVFLTTATIVSVGFIVLLLGVKEPRSQRRGA
jgi:MFS family permease